jgi:hypothetical protein
MNRCSGEKQFAALSGCSVHDAARRSFQRKERKDAKNAKKTLVFSFASLAFFANFASLFRCTQPLVERRQRAEMGQSFQLHPSCSTALRATRDA